VRMKYIKSRGVSQDVMSFGPWQHNELKIAKTLADGEQARQRVEWKGDRRQKTRDKRDKGAFH